MFATHALFPWADIVVQMQTPPERKKQAATPRASAVLADGTIAEMIIDHSGARTMFVLYKDGQITEQDSVDVGGSRAVPFAATNNLLSHGVVVLPTGVGTYDSTPQLVSDLRTFVRRYCDLEAECEDVAIHYVLLSWVYDAFNEVPYLRVRGDYGSGKTRFLQTIGSLCYKAIFASGASTVSPIFRTLDAFQGTLVLDEGDFRESDARSEIAKILNNGHARGFPVLRSEQTREKEYNPTAFHVFGPKLIASRSAFTDRALESRCITFDLPSKRPRPGIPLNLPTVFHDEAAQLRNKLLRYRFDERLQPRDLESAMTLAVEARVSQVFAPLIAVANDNDVVRQLRAIAVRSSAILAADRAMSIEAHLLDVIFQLQVEEEPLTVKQIAARFESTYFADYRRPITPRWIGSLLRNRLHITAVKTRGNFSIPSTELPRIEVLFSRYGIGSELAE